MASARTRAQQAGFDQLTYRSHEGLDQFGRIGDEELEVFVDCEYCHHRVLADERVAVLLRNPRAARSAPRPSDSNSAQYWLWVRTRQARHEGIRGSRSSGSRIFWRNRRVAPRMYSFGCCCAREIQLISISTEWLFDEAGVVNLRGRCGWRCCARGERTAAGGGQHTEHTYHANHNLAPNSPNQDHLLLQLAILIKLGANLPVKAATQRVPRLAQHSDSAQAARESAYWSSFLMCLLLDGNTN